MGRFSTFMRGRTVRVGNPRLALTSTRRAPRPGAGPSARLAAGLKIATAVKKAMKSRTSTALVHQRRRRLGPNHSAIQNAGGVITRSKYVSANPMSLSAKIRSKASMPTFLVQNAPSQFNALCGFQGVYWQALQNRVQLTEYYNQLPVPVPVGNATRALYLDYTTADIHFTNASNASCTVDLYDIVCKQDNDLTSPLTAWANGIAMETNGLANNYEILGVLPTMSQQFNEFFKIVKVTHVNLAAGASHRHNIMLKYRKQIREQRVKENVNYAGISYFTMLVVRGVPISDKTGSDPAIREVSSAPIGIDVVTQISAKFRYTQDLDTDITLLNQMVSLAAPDVMNTFNSSAVPVAKAN